MQLTWAGFSSSTISRRVREGWLHGVHRGVYALGHTDLSEKGRLMAAALAYRDRAVVSHSSAAYLWGQSPTCPPLDHITVPDPTRRHKIPVTKPDRTRRDLGYDGHRPEAADRRGRRLPLPRRPCGVPGRPRPRPLLRRAGIRSYSLRRRRARRRRRRRLLRAGQSFSEHPGVAVADRRRVAALVEALGVGAIESGVELDVGRATHASPA